MNTQDIERFEALLKRYGLEGLAYNPSYILSFTEGREEQLYDQGIEEGEEIDDLNFLFMNAENYAGVVEDREADEAYERALTRAIQRRMIDPFYTII